MLSNADRWCGHQHYFRSHLYFGYFGLPAMGTRGAAIATVAGQIIAMLLGLYFNLTKIQMCSLILNALN